MESTNIQIILKLIIVSCFKCNERETEFEIKPNHIKTYHEANIKVFIWIFFLELGSHFVYSQSVLVLLLLKLVLIFQNNVKYIVTYKPSYGHRHWIIYYVSLYSWQGIGAYALK